MGLAEGSRKTLTSCHNMPFERFLISQGPRWQIFNKHIKVLDMGDKCPTHIIISPDFLNSIYNILQIKLYIVKCMKHSCIIFVFATIHTCVVI